MYNCSPLTLLVLLLSFAFGVCSIANADPPPRTWTYAWSPAPGESVPRAAICPIKYGKTWAYAVEIDDGPISALTVSQPLLERFTFTDAPTGVSGGKTMPFVGGVAVMVLRVGAGNNTFLDWDQLETLRKKGWGILNHSYWHSGNSGEPKGALTPVEFHRELFWSQVLFASLQPGGRSPSHFVYPNGYMDYEPYLKEYGFRSGSRVAGKRCNLLAMDAKLTDLDRSYLDEGPWAKSADVMDGFPKVIKPGDFVIDFTHGMDADPKSANNKRWNERLTRISKRYGKAGDDSLWCAPTSDVIEYTLAARAAKLNTDNGKLTVTLPESVPGASLTVKLTGVNAQTTLKKPVGGTIYRRGDEVWITTPTLGVPGTASPAPTIKRIYEGVVRDVIFGKTVKVACVRVLQSGPVLSGYKLQIGLMAPDGSMVNLVSGPLANNWGVWQLYPVMPDHASLASIGIRINADPALTKMEVWGEE